MTVFLVFCPEGSANGPVNSPANLKLGIFSLDLVYARNKPDGMWLSPTSRLSPSTGGLLLLCYYSELHGCSGQTERQCFELVCPTLDMKFANLIVN